MHLPCCLIRCVLSPVSSLSFFAAFSSRLISVTRRAASPDSACECASDAVDAAEALSGCGGAGSGGAVEVVQSVFRWADPSTVTDTVLTGRTNLGDFGSGTTVPATWNAAVCQYDLIQVRLEPRAHAVTAPTVAIQGGNPRRTSSYCKVPVQL